MPFIDTTKLDPKPILPGWTGCFVHSDNMTFAYFTTEEASEPVSEHHHPHEEMWNILEGELEVMIDGVTQTVGPGCVAVVPSGVRHAVRALCASRAIVVDFPNRDEFGGTQTR